MADRLRAAAAAQSGDPPQLVDEVLLDATHVWDHFRVEVAVAALRCGPAQLLAGLNSLGYLFEALVARDLRVFADVVDGTVQRYRDSDDLEIDEVATAGDVQARSWSSSATRSASDA